MTDRDVRLFSSALGVTMPGYGDVFRFSYSVEKKEIGRQEAGNLMAAKRFVGGSVQLHEQEIHIADDGCGSSLVKAMKDFYKVFDIREHGNNLIMFSVVNDDSLVEVTHKYRAFLPCAEPAEK